MSITKEKITYFIIYSTKNKVELSKNNQKKFRLVSFHKEGGGGIARGEAYLSRSSSCPFQKQKLGKRTAETVSLRLWERNSRLT
jgi:hypothetical protein